MNLYKRITESSWDISEDERIRMYNLIQSVYGPKWTEKQIENINTTTDEKLERLYNSALKKFKKKQAVQKDISIEDRIPKYVKDSYKEYIRNHTRTFNNKHNSEEELVKAEDNMNRSIKSFIEEYYPDLYIELWKEDLMEETNMNIYENIKKNLKESDDYVAGFDEIIDQMAVAEDYSELYSAASLIQDPSIRVDVEQCIEQCEEDGDDVETAYSVTTSDYLDMYAMQGVENTPTAEADYRASLKKESEEIKNDSTDEKLDYFAEQYYKYYEEPHRWTKKEMQDWLHDEIEVNKNMLYSYDDLKLLLDFQHDLYREDKLDESNLEPQYSTRKSFYGKANVNDDNTLVSYGTPIMKIEDGKIQMLCRPEHLTQTTLRHIREFMQQNGMEPIAKRDIVKMIEEQGNVKESEELKESEDIEVLGYKNQYGYTIQQVYINYPEKTYEVGSITMRNDKTISRKEFLKTIERLKQAGFKEVKRNKSESNLEESEELKESSNIIWTSETTEDDYDPEDLKERYQEYVDSFEAEEDEETGEVSEPKEFDDWKYDYIADDSYDQWDMKKEDLASNIYPMIDKQINNDILIVSGNYNSNYPDFRKSGNGGKFLNKAEDILDWLGNEDRVEILNNDGIVGVAGYDHDGSISGNLYTVPADDDLLYEIAMKTDYYDKDRTKEDVLGEFSYDVNHGNIDMSDFWGYEDKLIPIKVEW